MVTDIKPLLNCFDAFGWIPTLRGALSLDLMGESSHMLGDVDRFSVEIINHVGLSTERFLAATSLHNVSDSKYGKDYIRCFRYFFYGTIHNQEDGDLFLNALPQNIREDVSSTSINNLVRNEGILLGHLFIVLEETYSLSNLEISIINEIKSLMEKKEEYVYKFSHIAESLAELDVLRHEMKSRWTSIRNHMEQLRNEAKKMFHFEILLTRDGIILLKDCTENPTSKVLYTEPNTPSDYTINVPIHRIFKTAMNFIKFLFHKNYHHEKENDTFLPASNLHPYRSRNDFSHIFKHQLDSFLTPIMKLRRKGENGIKYVNIDPTGILNYAKSFIYTCQNNGLIDEPQAKNQLNYITLLESESTHSLRYNRSLLSSLATQNSTFVIISTILAFMVAVLKIFESGMRINGSDTNLFVNYSWHYTFLALLGLGICGYIFLWISKKHAAKKEFHINRVLKFKNDIVSWIFHKDSNIPNAKFSWRLRLYIWLQNTWYDCFISHIPRRYYGRQSVEIVKILFWICLLVGVVYALITIFRN